MENMFDSVCCALMEPANRDRFLRGEGLQLMNLMLRYLAYKQLLITVPVASEILLLSFVSKSIY